MSAEQLLHALADGRLHSGEELARSFGIPRAALSQQLAELADWGLAVEATRGNAFRLPHRLELLDADAVRAALEPATAARLARLEVHTELGSTNRRLAAVAPPLGLLDVCIAEFQTEGRGRRGRRWSVPLGGGICLSVGWRFAGTPAEPAPLTLAVGVAVRRVLARLAGLSIGLKWPNDLVYDERKLGGILVELAGVAQGGVHAIVGIGLNVALQPNLLPSLSDWPRGAIDLKTALGREPPARAALAGALVNELAELLVDYPLHGFALYRDEWRAADSLRGRAVRVARADGTLLGTAAGIDAGGALLVELENGDCQRLFAGDVSVRSAP